MSIKEEIAKIEGLVEALKNEIEVWFEKHFDMDKHAQAKTELHETLGTDTVTHIPVTPAPAPAAPAAAPAATTQA